MSRRDLGARRRRGQECHDERGAQSRGVPVPFEPRTAGPIRRLPVSRFPVPGQGGCGQDRERVDGLILLLDLDLGDQQLGDEADTGTPPLSAPQTPLKTSTLSLAAMILPNAASGVPIRSTPRTSSGARSSV